MLRKAITIDYCGEVNFEAELAFDRAELSKKGLL